MDIRRLWGDARRDEVGPGAVSKASQTRFRAEGHSQGGLRGTLEPKPLQKESLLCLSSRTLSRTSLLAFNDPVFGMARGGPRGA